MPQSLIPTDASSDMGADVATAKSLAPLGPMAQVVATRLQQALRLSCLSERLLDLSRTGLTAATIPLLAEHLAPYFVVRAASTRSHPSPLLSLAEDSGDEKIQGLSLSHNPHLGPMGLKALTHALTRFVFADSPPALQRPTATGSRAPTPLRPAGGAFSHRCVAWAQYSSPLIGPKAHHCLHALDIYNVGLTDQCMPDLLDCVERGAPALAKLKIGDNHITAAGIRLLCQRPSALRCVSQIHLGGNPLLCEGVQHLALLLLSMPCLTNVGLRDVQCEDAGLAQLFGCLLQRHRQTGMAAATTPTGEGGPVVWTGLIELQLRGNTIRQARTLELLCQCVRERALASLQVLDLAACKAPDAAMAALYTTLAACATAPPPASSVSLGPAVALREADFSGNALGPCAAAAMKQLLEAAASPLISLKLASCRYATSATMDIALQGLVGNRSISNLSLAQNPMQGHACAAAIAHALTLPRCPILALDISNCAIGPQGMAQIFAALAADRAKTKVLEAAGNGGGPNCVEALRSMVAHNRHLTKLHIQDNAIPLPGMAAVADAVVASNTTLRQLSFGGQSVNANAVTPAIRLALNHAMVRNKAARERERSSMGHDQSPTSDASPGAAAMSDGEATSPSFIFKPPPPPPAAAAVAPSNQALLQRQLLSPPPQHAVAADEACSFFSPSSGCGRAAVCAMQSKVRLPSLWHIPDLFACFRDL